MGTKCEPYAHLYTGGTRASTIQAAQVGQGWVRRLRDGWQLLAEKTQKDAIKIDLSLKGWFEFELDVKWCKTAKKCEGYVKNR